MNDFKMKTIMNYKKNHDEVWNLKEETEKLKKMLKKKTSIEEVEDLIIENKNLRSKLQKMIGRPLAENDLEHPDSFQDALLLTEDLIKKKKLDSAISEMKEKLLKESRCLICTLKTPCKHSDKEALAIIPKEKNCLELVLPNNNTFITGSDVDLPKRFRIRSCRGRNEYIDKKTEDKNEKMIKEAQKRLETLTKIEAFREEKLRNEIEKMENELKIEKELAEKKKIEEEKKKKYYDLQKEKLNEYVKNKTKMEKKKEKRPQSQKIRIRPYSNKKINDYQNKTSLVLEILKHQTKLIKSLNESKGLIEEDKKVEDSVALLYNY